MIVERIHALKTTAPAPGTWEGIHRMDHQNWLKAISVRASFNIYHDGTHIYLTYFVKEEQVRAVNTEFNSPVWEDSCVEFFFSPPGVGDSYYNFEFNAIGAVLGAFGKNRYERNPLQPSTLEKIEVIPSLGRNPLGSIDKPTRWNLWVKIPVSVLTFSHIEDLSELDAHGNFYKCGDLLDHPHYLSWKPVLSPDPDFHLPNYFGQLSFM